MRSKLLNRKKWSDESGVSEIIGNILILMITVVLFTGIIGFVNQMPVPQMTTKADFSADVAFSESGTVADISVTHRGGATLQSSETVVLVSIDSTTHSFRLSDDIGFDRDEWVTGVSWTKQFSGTEYQSSIYVTVLDDVRHSAIWTSQLSGGTGGNPPTILQRYVDSNAETMTVDPVKKDDSFTLFVKVSDQDNDLLSVWLDSSSLVGGSVEHQFDRPTTGTVAPQGGWFEWDFDSDFTQDVTKIDGKTLLIYARDVAGHTTAVPFRMSVVVLPVVPLWINVTDTQPGGMPPYIKNVNEGQGFAVFGEDIPNGTADTDDPRIIFTRGETVFVRVASLYVSNTDGGNELTFVDARTKVDYTMPDMFRSPSTMTDPFYSYAYGGNVAIFEAIFNTTDMMPGTYAMSMYIQETGASTYWFKAEQTLYIEDPNSPIDYYPTVWLYRDDGYSQDWGSTRETTFSATGTDCKVYVAIRVQDTNPGPSMGEVRIVDMTGGTQLFGPPGSGEMISPVTPSETNSTAYVFHIDLRYSNGDLWKAGTNSYTLQISQFSDNNEGVYSYSRQVFVTGFSSRADFVLGTNGVYATKGGSTNFISPEYVYYVENNNFFTKRTLYYQENAPSTAPLFYHNAMALGDLDNDGDLDLLVGSNMDQTGSYPHIGQLLYFENSLNTYGIWQSPSVITRPDATTSKIEWIDMGDINGDGYTDFAYSTSAHNVVIFNNTYAAVGANFKTWDSTDEGVRKIALRDMTGDGRADLIVLVNGRIEMYDLTKWTSGLFAQLPNPDVVPDPAHYNIEDFDIADINNDGMLDIITVDPNSASHDLIEGVWVNNYTENADSDKKYAVAVETLVPQIGSIVDGTDLDNTEVYGEGEVLSIRENTTGDNIGNVSYVLRMDTLSPYTDPQLVVRAKVPAGAKEVFYIWYSTDPDPVTAKYTPVMVVTGSSYRDYVYNLPASVANSANFRLKITDSAKTLGDTVDQIDIDYIAIESNRFGTYWPNPMTGAPSRYQVVGVAEQYLCARAINFDGLEDGMLEVVVAKNGKFAVYDYVTPVTDWVKDGLTGFQVFPTAGTGLSNAVGISPSLFEVADINGDGLGDLLTTWVTVGDSYEASLLKAYINVGPTETPWEVNIKDLFAGFLATSEKGCIVKIAAGDIFIRG